MIFHDSAISPRYLCIIYSESAYPADTIGESGEGSDRGRLWTDLFFPPWKLFPPSCGLNCCAYAICTRRKNRTRIEFATTMVGALKCFSTFRCNIWRHWRKLPFLRSL